MSLPSLQSDALNSGLGHFSKLPPELREMIWLEFRPAQSPANTRPKCDLRVLRVSKQLRDEIEDAVYRRTTLELSISSNYLEVPGKWDKPFATVFFKTCYRKKQIRATWVLKADGVVVDNWFNGFPFHKIHSLEVNLLAAGLARDSQLLWLWRNIMRTVRLLKMAKSIPSMTVRLQKCEYGYHEKDGVDLLCRAYYQKKEFCHDLILIPFYNVPNPKSITIETHSERLSKKIRWSVLKWANDLITKKPDGYLRELDQCMFMGKYWVHNRIFFQTDRSQLAECLRDEWDAEEFYPW